MSLGLLCILALGVFFTPETSSNRLSIQGDHFSWGGQRVFLLGGNLAWVHYAYDFGNHRWSGIRSTVENQMKMLRQAGGNVMRVWIHIQGESSPKFNDEGYVVAPDDEGTFMSDFKDLLDLALQNHILIIPALWNCAVNHDYYHRLDGLILDYRKTNSYLDIVLKPLVREVRGHPALAAWDVVNEPEGKVIPNMYDGDRCFDTRALKDSGAGFAGHNYTYHELLRFVNMQAAAIKDVDPQALVTVGVWNPKSCTDQFGMNNHYKDECLIKAGGKSNGVLDFYQFHTYSWKNKYDDVSPFEHQYSDYETDKPILIGEFDQRAGGGYSIYSLFRMAYERDYAGAMSWMLINDGSRHRPAMSAIKDETSHGIINFF